MVNVKDFGAKGDGVTLDTQAIQSAIDAGGEVYFPEGVYLTGTIYLKSNGGLNLSENAVIKASTNRDDYNKNDFCPQNQVFSAEGVTGAHLICAVEQENIFIKGMGTIDGCSQFWVNDTATNEWGFYLANANPNIPRHAQMIFFAECKKIIVENVTLQNSPYWHLFLHGCEDAQIHGLTINGCRLQWTNDGIDLDCCRNVTVSDCIIDVGDDAITLRANGKNLVIKDDICEYVTITNCILTSYLGYGMRIGVGEGIIKNCVISNTIIKDSLTAIGITCRYRPVSKGVSVENLMFNNMIMDALRTFEIRTSNSDEHPPFETERHIKGLVFSNIISACTRPSTFIGYENGGVSDISFNNVTFNFSKESESNDRLNIRWGDVDGNNGALCLKRTKNINTNGITVNGIDDLKEFKCKIKTIK